MSATTQITAEAGMLTEHWYVAGTAERLRRKGLMSAKIFGLGIVVFRRRDDSIAALLDQCLHRGTALSGGRLRDDCIECPYHGWRYDGDGRVVLIPSEDGDTLPDQPRDFAQRAFSVVESHGLIWVYMGNNEPDASDIFEMPFHGDSGWVTYYMVSNFEGTVSALAQNFMDVPHTVHVHDTIFRSSPKKEIRSTVSLRPASVEVEYHEEDDSIGMMPWLTNPKRQPLVHTDKFFAPNVTRCDYHWGEESGFVITSQITPKDAHSCQVFTLISYRFPWPLWIARLLRPLIHLYTRIVLEQDIRIMRVNQRGIGNAPDYRARSVKADRVHVGIERVIAAAQSGTPIPDDYLGDHPVDFYL